MVVIRSEANKTYRELARLHKTRAIVKSGKALVPGFKVIRELLAREPERCLSLIQEDGLDDNRLHGGKVPIITLSPPLFRKLDRWGCGPPLLLVKVAPYPVWTEHEWVTGCSLIVPFQDPRNLGATLRSAAAFEAGSVILTAEAAHPMHPEAVRSAAGTEGLLDIYAGPSLDEIGSLPRPILALDLNGAPLSEVAWPTAFGLVVGTEGKGLPPSLPKEAERIRIPIEAGVESLNANAALAIALYAWRRSVSTIRRTNS